MVYNIYVIYQLIFNVNMYRFRSINQQQKTALYLMKIKWCVLLSSCQENVPHIIMICPDCSYSHAKIPNNEHLCAPIGRGESHPPRSHHSHSKISSVHTETHLVYPLDDTDSWCFAFIDVVVVVVGASLSP